MFASASLSSVANIAVLATPMSAGWSGIGPSDSVSSVGRHLFASSASFDYDLASISSSHSIDSDLANDAPAFLDYGLVAAVRSAGLDLLAEDTQSNGIAPSDSLITSIGCNLFASSASLDSSLSSTYSLASSLDLDEDNTPTFLQHGPLAASRFAELDLLAMCAAPDAPLLKQDGFDALVHPSSFPSWTALSAISSDDDASLCSLSSSASLAAVCADDGTDSHIATIAHVFPEAWWTAPAPAQAPAASRAPSTPEAATPTGTSVVLRQSHSFVRVSGIRIPTEDTWLSIAPPATSTDALALSPPISSSTPRPPLRQRLSRGFRRVSAIFA
jgi:hypothetical protein